jgi:hypothetical protein
LVLHRKRIGEGAMKKFGINFQCWSELFIVIFHFPTGKASMNAPRLCKLRKDCLTGIGHGAMVSTKRLHFFIFQFLKAEQGPLSTFQL